ncbi:LIM and calponin -like proteiny domains-containing protein 1 [Collichthys lucidus]|uniref:LIM and calponin-like proteiny domains-containing protein 1 n=1 Tax=Collichthys lucidus TaxID=240159 RepID=A0A4U5TYV4_COLLU|nr:LIM and calponin -like proteiny domains-containing protein 1 [Collichthys lucidus]
MEWRAQSAVSCDEAFSETRRWIEAVTKKKFGSTDFRSALENGVLLSLAWYFRDLDSNLKPHDHKFSSKRRAPRVGPRRSVTANHMEGNVSHVSTLSLPCCRALSELRGVLVGHSEPGSNLVLLLLPVVQEADGRAAFGEGLSQQLLDLSPTGLNPEGQS